MAALCIGAGLFTALAGPAQAAIPDHWGFAYVNKPAAAGTPDLNHQAGSWPPGFVVHSAPTGVGRVAVVFPRIASGGGVVHVTAVVDRDYWCQAERWFPSGPNEVVIVHCYKPGGGSVFAPFAVTFANSSKGPIPPGRAYGYVHFEPAVGTVSSFNSTGAPNIVTPAGAGIWTVSMPGLGSAVNAGGVQVTAGNAAKAAKCELGGWASSTGRQFFQVRCFNSLTTPLKTGWTLTYQRGRAVTGTQPKLFAYTFDNKPLAAGPYAPVPPAVNFNSAAGVNTIRDAGAGLRLVTFPQVGAPLPTNPNNVLVTPFKVGPGFCNLNTLWATLAGAPIVIVRDVACYTATGTRKSQASLITFTAAH